MSYALSVFLFWIMSLLGVPECEPVKGMETTGVCIEQPSQPTPPPPPVDRTPPGANAVAISNGF